MLREFVCMRYNESIRVVKEVCIMLRNLHIKGFKGWKDSEEIELAPITVLFGGNSSGKSSVGQFLVMLKQTIQQSDRKTVLFLDGEQASVNLGTPMDIFYNHDLDGCIDFSYTWDLKEKHEVDTEEKKRLVYNKIKFSGIINVENRDTQALEINHVSYELYDNEKQVATFSMSKSEDEEKRHGYELNGEGFSLYRKQGRAWKLPEPVKFYGFPDAVTAYYQNAGFLQDLNLHHENLFSQLYYLGPMRRKAQRIYTWSGVSPESVGDDGSNAIAAILSSKNNNRMLNFRYCQKKPFLGIIAEELKKMGLISDFTIKKIDNRQEYDVKVRVKGSSSYVNIPDVGFGVSQVLPVIVELFYAPENSIIFIEQPEIHLHPAAQAHLADVIIDAINMSENGKKRNIQVILETHSEHLLRRLQRRMAEQKLSDEQLRAYFADNNMTPSKLERLQVDEYGNIENWPKGFFGDMEEDIYQQARNTVRRKIEERDRI